MQPAPKKAIRAIVSKKLRHAESDMCEWMSATR